MEYSLTINQLVLSYWKGKIDLTDAFIAAAIKKVEDSRSDKVIRKKVHRSDGSYAWIDHSWLLEQNPLFDISVVTLRKRLKHLVNIGLLDRFVDCDEDTKRYRAYYRLSRHYHNIHQYWKDRLDDISAGRETVQNAQQGLPLFDELVCTDQGKAGEKPRDNGGKYRAVVKNDHGPVVKYDQGAVVKNDHILFNDLPYNEEPYNDKEQPAKPARSKSSEKTVVKSGPAVREMTADENRTAGEILKTEGIEAARSYREALGVNG